MSHESRIIRCASTTPPGGCYYPINIVRGPLSSLPSSLTLSNIEVGGNTATPDAIAPATCGTGGILHMTFAHIVDDADRTVTVTTS
jgi:hypothetical protein